VEIFMAIAGLFGIMVVLIFVNDRYSV